MISTNAIVAATLNNLEWDADREWRDAVRVLVRTFRPEVFNEGFPMDHLSPAVAAIVREFYPHL